MKTKFPSPIITITILSTVTLVSAWAEPEIKGSPSELAAYLGSLPGSVRLIGEGEIKTPSDRAILSLRIDTEGKTLTAALEENQQIRSRLIKYLGDKKIPKESIKPAPFSAVPKTSIFSDKVKSYKISTLVKVTTHNEESFGVIARAVDQIKDVSFVQAEFEHSDEDNIRSRAIHEACEKVERQKRIYEAQLGVKLTPRNILDQSAGAAPVQERQYDSDGSYTSGRAKVYDSFSVSGGSDSEVVVASTAFGELVFKSRISVEYSVERK